MVSKRLCTPSKSILLMAGCIHSVISNRDRKLLRPGNTYFVFLKPSTTLRFSDIIISGGDLYVCKLGFTEERINIVRYKNIPTFEPFILIPSIFIVY